ncbi:MAG TPA: hypothetical protein VK464_26200 [Symbiobacteriaceae bacterium]|jgi:hypothetical protein|nr:hypothetical protein [Symbiobacteriaceae bacterium]
MTNDNRPQAAVLVANSVAMEVGTNNPVIIGAFNALQSRVFPARVGFYAVAKVWGMPVGEAKTCMIRLVDPETKQVIGETGEHRFNVTSTTDVHTAISMFQNVLVPKSGTYEVQVTTGGEAIGIFPLTIGSPKA